MTYEAIMDLVTEHNIEVVELNAPEKLKGLLLDDCIFINKNISTIEKKCVLAEEFAHYKLNYGNILNQQIMSNRKQEKKARNLAYELLVPINEFINAFQQGCTSLYDVAEFFDVTESFLNDALEHYRQKYGKYLVINRCYTVYFDPPGVLSKR